MSERWRCFVAVPVPASLRRALERSVTEWRADPVVPDLRWTAPTGWHLTLAFLGDIEPALVPRVLAGMGTAVGGRPAWRVHTGGIGAFPHPRRARVLWYGVDDPDGRLGELAGALGSALRESIPPLRGGEPFRGHVTLARARPPRGVDLVDWLAGHAVPSGSLPVQKVVLYRSMSGDGRPARHGVLGAVALAAPRGAIMGPEAEASTDG